MTRGVPLVETTGSIQTTVSEQDTKDTPEVPVTPLLPTGLLGVCRPVLEIVHSQDTGGSRGRRKVGRRTQTERPPNSVYGATKDTQGRVVPTNQERRPDPSHETFRDYRRVRGTGQGVGDGTPTGPEEEKDVHVMGQPLTLFMKVPLDLLLYPIQVSSTPMFHSSSIGREMFDRRTCATVKESEQELSRGTRVL